MKKLILTLITSVSQFLFPALSIAQVGLSFNGTNNSVISGGSPVLGNQARTVDAWIKTTNTITTQKVICDWGDMSLGQRFTLNLINNRIRIEVGGVGIAGSTPLNTGQWFHVTAVYNPSITSGANVFLYVNGALETSGNFTGYSILNTATTNGFRIGVRQDGINFFEGAVDEVKVYNYARTQAQVAADTLELCTPLTGLVAYYKLNEGIPNAMNTGSTTAIDYSGFGNNGTLNSFTLSGTTSNWVTGRVNSTLPTISANPGPNICTGGSTSLTTNAVSGFTWSTGNTTSTLIVVSPSASTVYSISQTNSLSCTSTGTLGVTVNNAPPSVTVTTTQNPICLGASTSFSATGANTYSWTGGVANGQTFTPSVTTNYSLTATNGCGTVNSVHTITVTPLPITVLATPSLVCEGYTCALTAVATATNYTWTPGSANGSSVVVAPMANTIYTVSATDGTCVGTQTVQVVTKPTPSIAISNSLITLCAGQSVTMTASGAGVGGTYSWSPGGVNGASVSASPTVSMVYTAYGSNTVGCTSSAQIPLVVLATPPVSATSSATLVCLGSSVTLMATGASSYSWSTGTNSAITTVTPSSGLTVYIVTAAASGNSCTSTETIGIAVITPSVTYTSSVSICEGANAVLSASGASTYSWNNIPAGTTGQFTVSPIQNTSYTLTAITQSLGVNCMSNHTAAVSVNPNPTITIIPSQTVILCKGNVITLTASGAVSYTWTGQSSNSAQINVSPNVQTSYTVSGSSAGGCTVSAQHLVKVVNCGGTDEHYAKSAISLYPNPVNGFLHVETDSEIVLDLYSISGKLVKSFRIGTGITDVDMTDCSAGLYVLRGKDENSGFRYKITVE